MMTHLTEPKRWLHIWQQNINKSLVAQLDLLHSLSPLDYNIAVIQEPYIDHLGNSRSTPHWISIYPQGHLDSPKSTRSLTLVNRSLISTNAWTQVLVANPDITALRLESNLGPVYIYNIYNDSTHARDLEALKTHLCERERGPTEGQYIHMVWFGNFNHHHPLWDEE